MKYVIYKITIIHKPEFIYVGKTKNFTDRKSEHKNRSYFKYPERLLYKTIRENGGWDFAEISPVELYECENKIEALIRERYWLETLQANMNTMLKPITTEEEKKQRDTEYKAKWFQDNKERLTEKNKKYHQENKEEIKKKQHELYEKNKKERLEKAKEYRENNKEEIKLKQGEKIKCECGKEHTRSTKARHLKTQFHQDFICRKSQA